MDDLISRQAAIAALREIEFSQYMEFGEYIGEDTREVRLIRAEKAQETIERLPTIEERKTGHWIDEEGSPFYCSECGRYQYNNTLDIMQGDYKFCPYCGADMRGV